MKLLVLSAEAAAAATTRQPCETCVGRSLLPGASAIRCVDRKPPLLRFVPVDDTRTPYEPCSRCGGHGMVDGMDGPRDCPECGGDCNVRARDACGRFTTVPVDTYTEGERIQIAVVCAVCGDTDDPGEVVCPTTGCLTRCDDCEGNGYRVVATATVARVLPIVDGDVECGRTFDDSKPHLCWWQNPNHTCVFDGNGDIDLSDHLPFVTFTPGGTAIELAEVTG